MKSGGLRERIADRRSLGLATALALLLIALLLPPFKLPRDTYTYLVFLDITQSMDVEDHELDGTPISRQAFAREAMRRAIRDLPCGSRVGLGAFSEYRTLLLLAPIEVCDNYNDLLVTLNYIDGRMRWRNSSEVAKGVSWAVRAAREIGAGTNVVFLTDGQESPPLRPSVQLLFDDVKPGEVRGWLVGVGGDVALPIPKSDRDGNSLGYWRPEDVVQRAGEPTGGGADQDREHLSALREAHLLKISRQTGFDYARLLKPSSLSEAMRDGRFAARAAVPTELAWLPTAAALLLLAILYRPDRLRGRTGRAAAQGLRRGNRPPVP